MELLPSRERESITRKANKLGLYLRHNWTIKEDSILKEHYEKDGIEKCIELLPNRTINAIKDEAFKLGLRLSERKNWTIEEDVILKQYYGKYGIKKCMNMLPDRTRSAIESEIHKLNLLRNKN